MSTLTDDPRETGAPRADAVNSPEWWERYFHGEWEQFEGPSQTRHFMQRLVEELPEPHSRLLQVHATSFLDWGCAFGDGSAVLAAAFPHASVAGVDIAPAAISEAQARFPSLHFSREGEGLPTGAVATARDVIVNSNCLEHFADWLSVLEQNVKFARLLHIVLVPYREERLHPHHVVSLSEDSFPESIEQHLRVFTKVIDVDHRFWPSGKQLMVGYASEIYARLCSTEARFRASHPDALQYLLRPASAAVAMRALASDVAEILQPLLAPRATLLEADWQGGLLPIEAASRGFDVTVSGPSTEDREYAQAVFDAHGCSATFEREGQPPGARYDVVARMAVLEPLDRDRVRCTLRRLAERSHRYVILVRPNPACYWYWIWRIHGVANSAWTRSPEAAEVLAPEIFKEAGLEVLHEQPVGDACTEALITDIGFDEDVRRAITEIHRTGLVEPLTRGCFLVTVAAVREASVEVSDPWPVLPTNREERSPMALVADALGGRLAAEHRLSQTEAALASKSVEVDSLRTSLGEKQAKLIEISNWAKALSERETEAQRRVEEANSLRLELQSRLDELNVANGRLMEAQRQLSELSEWATRIRVEERERAEAERFEAVQSILEISAQEKEQSIRLGEVTQEAEDLKKRVRMFEQSLQDETQERARLAARVEDLQRELEAERVVRQMKTRSFLADGLGRARNAAHVALTNPREFARRVYLRIPMTPATRHRVSTYLRRVLRKRPGAPMPAVVEAHANFQPAAASDAFADVFVFAIIDWHFRIQRPQHLSRELARLGHRVFYLSNHFADEAQPGFQCEQLDESGRLFQVRLNVRGSPAIYFAPPAAADAASALASLSKLLLNIRPARCIALVEHPYWWSLALQLPNNTVVYDCMDHHEGFGGMPEELLDIERTARKSADVLVTTSDWLLDRFRSERPHVELVRNACDFDLFSVRPKDVWRDPEGRRVVGYYGAIAEWFDVELLELLASELPDVCFRLIGSDTAQAASRLARLGNVQFTGERPYGELPFHLYGFDVCLLPFKVIPLTLATNPVKVYEYLAAGRSVVSVDLPEIRQFGELVRTAADHRSFLDQVREALANPPDEETVSKRRSFASRQTWRDRAAALSRAFETAVEPRVSVIVLTYNNLALTQACLQSVEAESDYPNLELIVVDNCSTDGSRDWLRQWGEGRPNTRLLLNDTNAGFAAGNNIGLRVATGEYLAMLNNDTFVTRGWVRTLLGHFRRNPKLGLLGPVTNNIGNEAKIDIDYASMEEMAVQAQRYTLAHAGQAIRLPTAAFFCVMMRRAVYESVGGLCEEFTRGFFEDDDYCRRTERAGWTIECAEDVFVHHHLSASFNALGATEKAELFRKNQALYEAKWGDWQPHVYRPRK